jgi:hypothetical protein
MPILTLTFPPGSVAQVSGGGTKTVLSVNTVDVVINIDDVDGNGTISNAEWDAYVGGGGGNDDGDSTHLFESAGGGSGTLYSTSGETYVVGQDVSTIVSALNNSFEADVSSVVCFTGGTLIESRRGSIPVEKLRVGDCILTRDNAFQEIKWIGTHEINNRQLTMNDKLRPIHIKRGALGRNLPERDMYVSRQHRMLVSSPIAKRMFNTSEVLIPAIKLVGLPGITVSDDCTDITYFHLMFKRHEVIFAEGAPTESLFVGPEALDAVQAAGRKQILDIFPCIADPQFIPKSASFIPKAPQQKRLIERHTKNKKPLIA